MGTLLRRSRRCTAVHPIEVEGGVDHGDMGEGLGEIAHEASKARIVLLREEAEIIAQRQETGEEVPGIALATEENEAVDEPEAACQECSLTGRESVIGVGGASEPSGSTPRTDA